MRQGGRRDVAALGCLLAASGGIAIELGFGHGRDIPQQVRSGLTIEIVPNKVAQEVIRRLYGKTFNGKRVIVRQYIERKSHKDLDPQDDRRRPNLKVEKERYVEIEGLEHFSRTSSNN